VLSCDCPTLKDVLKGAPGSGEKDQGSNLEGGPGMLKIAHSMSESCKVPDQGQS